MFKEIYSFILFFMPFAVIINTTLSLDYLFKDIDHSARLVMAWGTNLTLLILGYFSLWFILIFLVLITAATLFVALKRNNINHKDIEILSLIYNPKQKEERHGVS